MKADKQLVSPYRDEGCAGECYKQYLPVTAPGSGVPPAWLLKPSLCPSQAKGCSCCFPVCRHRSPAGTAAQMDTDKVLPPSGPPSCRTHQRPKYRPAGPAWCLQANNTHPPTDHSLIPPAAGTCSLQPPHTVESGNYTERHLRKAL